MWLPPQFEKSELKRFLTGAGIKESDIVILEEERVEGFNIKTVILRAKLNSFTGDKALIRSIRGIQTVGGRQSLVTRLGDKLFCLFCNHDGQQKKDCRAWASKKDSVCQKCARKGHSGERCNYLGSAALKDEQE